MRVLGTCRYRLASMGLARPANPLGIAQRGAPERRVAQGLQDATPVFNGVGEVELAHEPVREREAQAVFPQVLDVDDSG